MRGTLDLSTEQAAAAVEATAEVNDKNLQQIVEISFQRVRPTSDEVRLIRLISENPERYASELESMYGGGFNLDVGHLVYFRYGFFRKFVTAKERISDIIIDKDNSSGRMFYRGFRPEVLAAFKILKLV